MKLEIIDDLLPQTNFDTISRVFASRQVAWTCVYNDPTQTGVQFCHVLYAHFAPCSHIWSVLEPIHPVMKPHAYLRVKANLQPKAEKIIQNNFHIDFANCITSIFYLNSNNGYTLFEDGTKIDSVANRLITFDSNLKHTGTTCTDQPTRMVINFNYFKRELL